MGQIGMVVGRGQDLTKFRQACHETTRPKLRLTRAIETANAHAPGEGVNGKVTDRS